MIFCQGCRRRREIEPAIIYKITIRQTWNYYTIIWRTLARAVYRLPLKRSGQSTHWNLNLAWGWQRGTNELNKAHNYCVAYGSKPTIWWTKRRQFVQTLTHPVHFIIIQRRCLSLTPRVPHNGIQGTAQRNVCRYTPHWIIIRAKVMWVEYKLAVQLSCEARLTRRSFLKFIFSMPSNDSNPRIVNQWSALKDVSN